MFELKMSDGVGWDGLRLLVDTIYAWALDEISTTATILKKKSPKIQYWLGFLYKIDKKENMLRWILGAHKTKNYAKKG